MTTSRKAHDEGELPEDPTDTGDVQFDHAIDRAESLLIAANPSTCDEKTYVAGTWIELARVINERQKDWS